MSKREITVEQVETIIKLTENGDFRGDIAEKVGVCKNTVLRYQKQFHLI